MLNQKQHQQKALYNFLASFFILFFVFDVAVFAQRQEVYLKEGWKFTHSDNPDNMRISYPDDSWENVTVPHDWAVSGPFDKEIDKQVVAIEQNGEKIPTEKTGRSGALPWIGVGWYRTHFQTTQQYSRYLLYFDGAMAEPKVFVNGQLAGEWKYGYTPFIVDITPYVHKEGDNVLAVRLENLPESSRWYPGAGLYRPIKLICTQNTAIAEWGINVRTENLDPQAGIADIKIDVDFVNNENRKQDLLLSMMSDDCPELNCDIPMNDSQSLSHSFRLHNVLGWTPEHPQLYTMTLFLRDAVSGEVFDQKSVKFGIRTIRVSEENGFELNGVSRKIKGVCLHHDLGMLGAALNKAALAHQLKLLKSMGCDAIRTSHNHPSQWQMELCDSLGLMVMAESFDMWVYPKCKNGYARFYKDWWRRDLTNLVEANKLHPSIVMWSIGNEIPEQWSAEGNKMTRDMQNLIHLLDPTRPVTAGMDKIENAMSSGYAHVLDVPGMNYRTHLYEKAHSVLRQGFVLGSETASTVSSRGVYKFPVELKTNQAYNDGQCSGYDVEYCWWSNLPEQDWVLQDDNDWVIGEFVWTGFDYLGEPTPYDEYWPSRSSYFGIFDLAGLPKDRYYLYRSHWNKNEHTIHLLPHWTWLDRVGQTTPVYCYTDYPSAELFVNGKSQGMRHKIKTTETDFKNNTDLLDRYRLRWNDVVYEPGELKVVVYDKNGVQAGEKIIKTAGKPHHVILECDRITISADGEDMAFITVKVVDKDGNLCPDADNQLNVKVEGAGIFKGICNGDATSTEVFTQPTMKAFHGMLSVGVVSNKQKGKMKVTVIANGLKSGSTTINVQ